MFVFAGGGVGSPAVSQLDFTLIEVLFEFGPFTVGRRPVFLGGPGLPAPGQVGLLVADDVFLEDGDVAVGGLDIEVAQESCADVDRQAVIDQFCGQKAAEVVRGEAATAQLGMVDGDGVAETGHEVIGQVVDALEV